MRFFLQISGGQDAGPLTGTPVPAHWAYMRRCRSSSDRRRFSHWCQMLLSSRAAIATTPTILLLHSTTSTTATTTTITTTTATTTTTTSTSTSTSYYLLLLPAERLRSLLKGSWDSVSRVVTGGRSALSKAILSKALLITLLTKSREPLMRSYED